MEVKDVVLTEEDKAFIKELTSEIHHPLPVFGMAYSDGEDGIIAKLVKRIITLEQKIDDLTEGEKK